jgi:hypothetical protein
MNPLHPPLASSALQFGHHGAQRCTTVTAGERVAAAISCSIGAAGPLSARAGIARAAARMRKAPRTSPEQLHISARMRSACLRTGCPPFSG